MRLTFRIALAVARIRRAHRAMLLAAGHEAGEGNVVTATFLMILYAVG